MSRDFFLINIAIFGLISSLVLPYIPFLGFGLYLTSIISFLIIIFLPSYHIFISKGAIFVSAMCLTVIISSLYSQALGYSSYNFGNYLEAFKYFQYIPYLILFSSIKRNISINLFYRYIYIAAFLYIAIFLLQIFNPFKLGYIISAFYLGGYDSVHLIGIETGFRIPITGSNPNVGAVIGVFFTLFFLVLFSNYRKAKDFILFIIIFVSVFFTQSRTTLIALFLALLLFTFFSKIKLIYKVLFLFLFLFAIYLSFAFIELDYIKDGYDLLMEGDNNSVNVRLDTLQIAIDNFRMSPFFGIGPSKNEFSTSIDSEYVLIMMRYGVLGIMTFISFIMYMLYKGLSNLSTISGLSLFLYTVTTLVIMLTNNAYSGYQLMSISILLLIMLKYEKNEKNYA